MGKKHKAGKPRGPAGAESEAAAAAAVREPIQQRRLTTPGIVPPGAECFWDPLLLGGTALNLGLHQLYEESVLAVEGFLTEGECRAWIAYGEDTGFQEAKQAQRSGFAHRDNGRLVVEDPDIADAIWNRIRSFVPCSISGRTPVGCSPNLRLYRYCKGQRFGKHVDEVTRFPNHTQSEFTLLLYLNGGEAAEATGQPLEGGETVFYERASDTRVGCSFSPLQGWCLFHGHGEQCLLHEGAVVRGGVKYVLRTDVLFQDPIEV